MTSRRLGGCGTRSGCSRARLIDCHEGRSVSLCILRSEDVRGGEEITYQKITDVNLDEQAATSGQTVDAPNGTHSPNGP
jgi:hypothetical protein